MNELVRLDVESLHESTVENVESVNQIICPYCGHNNYVQVADSHTIANLICELAQGFVIKCTHCQKMFHARGKFKLEVTSKAIETVVYNDRKFISDCYNRIDTARQHCQSSSYGKSYIQSITLDNEEYNLYERYTEPYLHNQDIDKSND